MGQHDQTADVSAHRDSFRGETGRAKADRLPEIQTADLSVGEHLLIWRRREGLTQDEAGNRLGISRNHYGEMEREEGRKHTRELPYIGELYSHEKCFIMRRRSGWTIPMCADQAGVSRYWYNLMELGKASPERLVEYWAENEG